MKILMINSVCGIRSTGRICTDLAIALEQAGHEVKIAYGRENVPEQYRKYAIKVSNYITVRFHGLKARLLDADGRGSYFRTKKFIKWVTEYNPDIIHLHNLHGYYINVLLLFDYIIKHDKKVIWTLHDMWPFTGHSGICDIRDCEKWVSGCTKCPLYREYPATLIDRSEFNYNWKKELFCQVNNLTIVTPSRWLSSLVSRSYLQKADIKVIPNGVDTDIFKLLKNDFKKFYGIENKILIMACITWRDYEKALTDIVKLSQMLDDCFRIALLSLEDKQVWDLPQNILGIKQTNSAKELTQMYNAADLFLSLGYVDNLPVINLKTLDHGMPISTCITNGSSEQLNKDKWVSFEKGDISCVSDYLAKRYVDVFLKNKKDKLCDKEMFVAEYRKDIDGGYFGMRHKYGVNGKIVVLGVAAFWNERKGMDTFIQLARDLPEDYQIIMVGTDDNIDCLLPDNVMSIHRTDSQEELAALYGIADVFVNPTIQENFPTVNLESVACGTPVVTYDTGGSPENSYTPSCVVKKKDYNGIKNLLLNRNFEYALEDIDRGFLGKKIMADRYKELYIL